MWPIGAWAGQTCPLLYEDTLLNISERPFAAAAVGTFADLVPAIFMMSVIWSWFIYLRSEGVEYLHWVATGFGVAGLSILLLSASLQVGMYPLLAELVSEGQVAFEDVFIAMFLIEVLRHAGISVFYGLYLAVLALACTRRRLLPRWYLVIVVIVALINDLNLFLGYRQRVLADGSYVVQVIIPFLLGVIMLRQAQKLARELTTPPPSASAPATPPLTGTRSTT
ncbi:MAG: hypothetical protein HC915_14345 [Anaerolineae bacterium]|nr:hypothetical protein [Anaerolineae bacterium]